MELRICAPLTGRDVKVIQPGLVYVMEALPDTIMSLMSSVPQDMDDADANIDDDQPRFRRARRRLGKIGTRTRTRPRRTYPTYPTTAMAGAHLRCMSPPCARTRHQVRIRRTSKYHNREHFSSIHDLHGLHNGLLEVREAPIASSSSPARQPHPRAGPSPSPIPGPSLCQCTPRLCWGPPRRLRCRRRARRCRLRPASACRSTPSTSRHVRRAPSRTRSPRSGVDADVDADSNTSELSSPMSLPLTFEDEDQDHEEAEEDPPPPGPTKKLGLPRAHRAAAVGRGAGAGGSARSSAGKIVIPG
jgi:hypothetical protein